MTSPRGVPLSLGPPKRYLYLSSTPLSHSTPARERPHTNTFCCHNFSADQNDQNAHPACGKAITLLVILLGKTILLILRIIYTDTTNNSPLPHDHDKVNGNRGALLSLPPPPRKGGRGARATDWAGGRGCQWDDGGSSSHLLSLSSLLLSLLSSSSLLSSPPPSLSMTFLTNTISLLDSTALLLMMHPPPS